MSQLLDSLLLLPTECRQQQQQRVQNLGEADPSLFILVIDQQEVILFARETLPRHGSSHTAAAAAAAAVCTPSSLHSNVLYHDVTLEQTVRHHIVRRFSIDRPVVDRRRAVG